MTTVHFSLRGFRDAGDRGRVAARRRRSDALRGGRLCPKSHLRFKMDNGLGPPSHWLLWWAKPTLQFWENRCAGAGR